MFTKIARICTYISLAAPLIATRSLFFPFITGKMLFFRVFTECALVAVAGAIAYKEISLNTLKNVVKKPIFIAMSVFTALFTLSAFTAQVPSFAFWSNFERGEGAWQMIHYFLFFFLIVLLFEGKKGSQSLITAQTLIATTIGLYAVGQMINWPIWIINPAGGAKSGTLGNPDYLGIYMAISGLLTIPLAYAHRGNKRLFFFLCAFFEIALFLSSKSRGAYVGVGVGLIFMLFVWLFQQKRGWKVTSSIAIGSFLIVLGIGALVFTVKGGNAFTDIQPRLWTWESALSGVIERPVFGWGAENFPFIFDRYYNPKHYQVESWFDRAHNAPLEYLTTGGIPLFLAYTGIFFVLYRRLFRKKNEEWLPFFAALPIIYIVNGFVLFETLPLYIILFLCIAHINAFTDDFKDSQSTRTFITPKENAIIQTIFIVLCALVPVSLYATAYRPLQKNRMILEAMRTDNKNDMELFQEHESILRYWSPVGNEEELQGLLTFTVSYFDYLQKNHLESQVPKEKIDTIMKFEADWYAKKGPDAIGVKALYIRITGLLSAYQLTHEVAYLQEADRLIAEGSAIAPTRIEFIRLSMASSALKNDKESYEKAVKKGKILLPSLDWPMKMAEFTH